MIKRIGSVAAAVVLLALAYYLYLDYVSPANNFKWHRSSVDPSKNQYTVMTANVGNSDWDCTVYKWKLCKKIVEARLAQNIQLVAPDIVALQEVLPPAKCAGVDETDARKVCSDPQDLHQARRLLGAGYTIVCESRSQYECTAVSTHAGGIDGCPEGGLCLAERTSPPGEGCDSGFSISAATVRLRNGAVFDAINVHPASMSTTCRAAMLKRAFQGDALAPSLIQNPAVLILGDFNFDPWRTRDESARAWDGITAQGWDGRAFVYHSGIAEASPPYYTFRFVLRGTYDLALSNFARGGCQVLGESPGTSRLDGGSGNDHRAVYCGLEIPPASAQ